MRGAVLGPAPRLGPRAVRLGAAEEERELRAVPELAQAPHQPRQLRRPAQVNTVFISHWKKGKIFLSTKNIQVKWVNTYLYYINTKIFE